MEHSTYKRFLSYIYAYNGEVRMRNTGFVKVEVKDGRCKLQVNLQRMTGQNSQPLEVFAFVESTEKDGVIYQLIPLGRMYLRNGNGELRCITYETDIAGSQIGLDNLEGIVIKGNSQTNQFCMTLWKHDKVDLEQLYKAQLLSSDNNRTAVPETKEKQEEISEIKQEIVEIKRKTHEPLEDNQRERILDEVIENNPILAETIPEDAEEEIVEVPPIEEVGEELRQTEAEDTKEKNIEIVEEEINGTLETQEVTNYPERQSQVTVPDLLLEGLLEKQEIEQVLNTHHEVEEDSEEEAFHQVEEDGEEQAFHQVKEDGKEEPLQHVRDDWKKLCAQLPRMNLTGCCPSMEVLKMQPADLGKLPKKNWGYGSNSFLLQSYCKHRHLILFCCREMQKADDKMHYYLGVPAAFPEKEKMMASMFGFPYYLSAGRNGYWYTEIEIGER